jgi:acyl-CoA thioesterase
MDYKFDRDIAVRDLGNRRYAADISADWNIAAPHGGYLLAIAGNALAKAFDCECPLSLTAYYHRPAAPGPAELQVEDVAETARFRTATAALNQNGKRVVTFVGAYSTGKPVEGPTHVRRRGEEVPPISDCVAFGQAPFSFFDQVRLYLPQSQVDWIAGKTTEDTVFTGYFEFTDGRPMDWLATLLFVDATPPPILRLTGPLTWVPTIEFTVQVRGVPTGNRVKYFAQTNYATDGLVETDLELWTESGDIVALARQLALTKEPMSTP